MNEPMLSYFEKLVIANIMKWQFCKRSLLACWK